MHRKITIRNKVFVHFICLTYYTVIKWYSESGTDITVCRGNYILDLKWMKLLFVQLHRILPKARN